MDKFTTAHVTYRSVCLTPQSPEVHEKVLVTLHLTITYVMAWIQVRVLCLKLFKKVNHKKTVLGKCKFLNLQSEII